MSASLRSPERRVLVAIPVWNGRSVLARCLEGLQAARVRACWRLLILDDASTDPEVPELCRDYVLSTQRAFEAQYRRNAVNRGFTANVNQAIAALRPAEHLVLLNSDTRVTRGWLDEMLETANEAENNAPAAIGTVTPFSNNATICSWPDFSREWPMPSPEEAERIAALLASERVPSIDLPTGVGFCMLITRDCLDAVGAFDEAAFPRGYGEENDFCRRAVKRGFRNVLCPNAYVAHEGSVSFSMQREALMRDGAAALLAKHPDYNDIVQSWIAQDPAAPRRRWLSERLNRGA
ncbi:MAG: glycosyltransferase family 2 protein [Casimicrobiaceae bacterium]